MNSRNSSDQIFYDLPDHDNISNKFEAGNDGDDDDEFQVNTNCANNICRMALFKDHKGWFVQNIRCQSVRRQSRRTPYLDP
ncbi:hypothetical protein MPTK1_6g17100 [Marchantia polymorpha subsp. ruderalis]|uniref:Uncharacterized protein n=2 Tax=Marchantia polymorpha TaxID=3197 RepID=A0AAF6BSX3_MARPO|nr:hypothetical protein MARPO_0144s0005 [Marchantia polymorpha]BBN15107.1 hypothetical protein Mp_6g17100 [Marchantia polymorpha subsp. ruderalis]|eukprot:PTQ29286.1 hypothetical protein MARPO_0144s0005 [Marchantia polymorpha]